MQHTQPYLRNLFLLTLMLLLHGCATTPVPFEQAAQNLAKKLLLEVKVKTLLSSSGIKKIVVDDFTDEDSGEVVTAGQQIEDIIFAEAEKNFHSFSISKMNSRNIEYADYLINGVISLEHHNHNNKEKFYHVFASATDLATGKIIAKASTWVAGKNLDYAPLREYKDSPMFLTDRWHKSKVVNARGVSSPDADSDYYDSIETGALLTEASSAYGKRDYPKAIPCSARLPNALTGKS